MTIFIIRHAEFGQDAPPYGIDHDGRHDDQGLQPRGWQRAGALAGLFAPRVGEVRPELAVPERLVAPAFGDPERSKARRMHATLTPLSESLGLAIQTPYGEGQEQALADELTGDATGVTLVCWGHTFIPTLAGLITAGGQANIPSRWPDDRFDVVWGFTANAADGLTFAQHPQLLLHDDREAPLS